MGAAPRGPVDVRRVDGDRAWPDLVRGKLDRRAAPDRDLHHATREANGGLAPADRPEVGPVDARRVDGDRRRAKLIRGEDRRSRAVTHSERGPARAVRPSFRARAVRVGRRARSPAVGRTAVGVRGFGRGASIVTAPASAKREGAGRDDRDARRREDLRRPHHLTSPHALRVNPVVSENATSTTARGLGTILRTVTTFVPTTTPAKASLQRRARPEVVPTLTPQSQHDPKADREASMGRRPSQCSQPIAVHPTERRVRP